MSRRKQLEEMLKSEPDDVFLNYALGKSFIEEGRIDDGLAQFRKTIALDADHVASYFQMAQVLASEGETEDARKIVTQGIGVARKVGDSHAEREMNEFLEMLS